MEGGVRTVALETEKTWRFCRAQINAVIVVSGAAEWRLVKGLLLVLPAWSAPDTAVGAEGHKQVTHSAYRNGGILGRSPFRTAWQLV